MPSTVTLQSFQACSDPRELTQIYLLLVGVKLKVELGQLAIFCDITYMSPMRTLQDLWNFEQSSNKAKFCEHLKIFETIWYPFYGRSHLLWNKAFGLQFRNFQIFIDNTVCIPLNLPPGSASTMEGFKAPSWKARLQVKHTLYHFKYAVSNINTLLTAVSDTPAVHPLHIIFSHILSLIHSL